MGEQEYPSVRKALLGNGHAANLWCGVKYTFWHLIYATLALFGLLAMVLKKLGADTAASKVHSAMMSDTAETIIETVLFASFIVLVVGWLGLIALAIYEQPMVAVYALAAWGGLHILYMVDEALDHRPSSAVAAKAAAAWATTKRTTVSGLDAAASGMGTTAETVSEKAPENVKERIYGYCPVSFDIEPKWFARFEESLRD